MPESELTGKIWLAMLVQDSTCFVQIDYKYNLLQKDMLSWYPNVPI